MAAPADKLPLAQLKLPKGFQIEVYASGIPERAFAAHRRQGNGIRRQSPAATRSMAIVDATASARSKAIATGLDRPNGLAFKDGTLYVAEAPESRSSRRSRTISTSRPSRSSSMSDLPTTRRTAGNSSAIGPDNKLYVTGRSTVQQLRRRQMPSGQIRRLALDGKDVEVVRPRCAAKWSVSTVSRSPRSSISPRIGGTGCPRTCRRDGLNRPHQGRDGHFGSPYCDQGDLPDRNSAGDTGAASSPSRSRMLGPHAAPLGMRFYTGTMFPSRSITTRSSWPATARGTRPTSSAATSRS